MMPWPPRGEEPIDWGDEPLEPPPPPSAGRSLRLGFGAAYDYAGTSLVASLIAFVAFYTAVSMLFAGALSLTTPRRVEGALLIGWTLLLAPIILGPLTAGLFALARAMFRRDDPHLRDILEGARRYARPAWALSYTQTLVTTILLGDVAFLLARPTAVLKVAGVLMAYVLLFWLMTTVYQWTLLVDRATPLLLTLRNAAVLSLARPFYTVAFTVLLLVLLVGPVVCFSLVFFGHHMAAAILVPVALAWGALVPCLLTAATLEILRKYDEAPEA